MKCNSRILLLALVIAAAVAVSATTRPVSADSCVAQLSHSTTTAYYYYNSNIGLNVPVSVKCSFSGGQLYAVGYAYDASTKAAQSSTNAVLKSAYGGNTYNGQLVFKLSPVVLGHDLRILVSIYGNGQSAYSNSAAGYSQPGNFPGCDPASMACNNGLPYMQSGSYGYYGYYGNAQYGTLLTTASENVQINPANPQTNNQYQSCGYYQNCYSQNQYGYCYNQGSSCYYNGYPYPRYSNGYSSAQNCPYYGCQSSCYYCDFNYNVCQSPSAYSNAAQCSGILFQGQNGCVELVVPVNSPYAAQVYQYYTLYNLPSSHPPIGSWVTVTGQLYQGYNGGSTYAAACPGNYINVSSIR